MLFISFTTFKNSFTTSCSTMFTTVFTIFTTTMFTTIFTIFTTTTTTTTTTFPWFSLVFSAAYAQPMRSLCAAYAQPTPFCVEPCLEGPRLELCSRPTPRGSSFLLLVRLHSSFSCGPSVTSTDHKVNIPRKNRKILPKIAEPEKYAF